MLRSISTFLVLFAPAVVSAQSDPVLWRLLPHDPKAVISIDWKTLRNSHLGAMLRDKFVDGNQAIPGAEFLDDVDRCLIASTGGNAGGPNGEPSVLIVVHGHFDLAKVRRVLADHGAKPQMFNSIQVYRPQNATNRDMAFVLLDSQTIVLGDAASVFASVERNANTGQPAEPSAIMKRAGELDSRYDAWAIMSGFDTASGDRLMGLIAGNTGGSTARSMEAGIALRNGLVADISLIFPTEPEARSMAVELSSLIKAAIKDKIGGPAMLDLEKKVKIIADGSVARINLRMSAQEFEKNARLFAESKKIETQSRAQQMPAAVAEAKPAGVLPPPAPKPEPKMIRIEGLDDGPREIKMKPEQP